MRAIVCTPFTGRNHPAHCINLSFFFHVFVHLSVGPSVSVFMCEQQETEGREAAALTSPYHLQPWVKWRDNCRSKYQQWKWRSVSDTAAWLALDHRHSGWLAHRRQWVTLLILDRRQVGAGVWSGGEAEVILCNLGEIQRWRHKLHSGYFVVVVVVVWVFICHCHAEGDAAGGKKKKRPTERRENNASIPTEKKGTKWLPSAILYKGCQRSLTVGQKSGRQGHAQTQ